MKLINFCLSNLILITCAWICEPCHAQEQIGHFSIDQMKKRLEHVRSNLRTVAKPSKKHPSSDCKSLKWRSKDGLTEIETHECYSSTGDNSSWRTQKFSSIQVSSGNKSNNNRVGVNGGSFSSNSSRSSFSSNNGNARIKGDEQK